MYVTILVVYPPPQAMNIRVNKYEDFEPGPARPTTSEAILSDIKATAIKAGLEDVYDALPGIEQMSWLTVNPYSHTAHSRLVAGIHLRVGHIVRLVLPPEDDPASTFCYVCIREPAIPVSKSPKKIYFPTLLVCSIPSEEWSARVGRIFIVKEGQIAPKGRARNTQPEDVFKEMTPLEPFGRLSQDWNDPDVLPMWHAVFAWYQLQTNHVDRVLGKWHLFQDAFLDALQCIKENSPGEFKEEDEGDE